MAEEFLIGKATEKELDELSYLFDKYRVFYQKNSDVEAAYEFIKQRITNDDAQIYFAFSKESKKLVGFTLLYPLFSSARMKRLWLLNDLFVLQEFRGKGISKMLIEKAKELVRFTSACGMMLETAKDNLIGNDLYPKTGFELEKGTNFYFWNNLQN